MSVSDEAADTRLGTCALFAALIKAVRVKDPLFAQRFLDSLDVVYDDLSRVERPSEGALDMIRLTKELTGRR